MTHILGINSTYHESSACLLKDGKMIAFAEEERFNRIKHAKPARVDNPDVLPVNAIQFCLDQGNIGFSDIHYIGFSFHPETRWRKCVSVDEPAGLIDHSWGTQTGEKLFYQKNLNIPNKLSDLAGLDISDRFYFLPHHLCHAASTFLVSPFKHSAILIIDGIAEFASTWLGYGDNHTIHELWEIDYPNSLGFLWEKMSEFLGFTEYDACKVMGLASYGESAKVMEKMNQIICLKDDGRFEINNDIMKFRKPDFSSLEALFQIEKRSEQTHIFAVHENIAAALQDVTEKVIIHLANQLQKTTRSKHICLAGGVALNCVANGKIIPNTQFESIFIQPAANDAGTAIGAAYYIWNQKLKKPRSNPLTHVYWGPEFSDQTIRKVLESHNLSYQKLESFESIIARMISQGSIVAWFDGRMEAGPRALGQRSILGDPRSPIIRDVLNNKVKYREIFRPFCPSVLKEDAGKWFEIEQFDDPAHYMLIACKVRKNKAERIPAVTHIDGTARIQLVTKETNPRYYQLISEFKRQTGIPIVLNTSFNIQEPIVCSPEHAIYTFKKSRIDCLVIGNFLVKKVW
ncbi:MAG: carbamoyltransferase [Candidatus Magnetoglobus multicellularis str. Araruama]|uniref:Carbamoyltransferase n=1 Tax=Candidatus Magnetoglobus multicellularis str. Araruama TaxID=890399 RepID=A0A1V1P602_9BACT|nr:MAG: carbamoyltransferase [Candidatus Magnetoglobus multicellularis str. Araruama]